RSIDRACHWLSTIDQRDVHREFVAAANEFLCAVERVDENETIGADEHLRCAGFLGDDQDIRNDLSEIAANDLVRSDICLCYRRAIALVLRAVRCRTHPQYLDASANRDHTKKPSQVVPGFVKMFLAQI